MSISSLTRSRDRSRARRAVVGSFVLLSSLSLSTVASPAGGGQPPEGESDLRDEHSSSSHGMHHDFGDVERYVERFEGPDREAWQKPAAVVEWMEIEPGMSVADLGAGTGYFLSHLSAAVGESRR